MTESSPPNYHETGSTRSTKYLLIVFSPVSQIIVRGLHFQSHTIGFSCGACLVKKGIVLDVQSHDCFYCFARMFCVPRFYVVRKWQFKQIRRNNYSVCNSLIRPIMPLVGFPPIISKFFYLLANHKP